MQKRDVISGVVIGELIAWLVFLIAKSIVANPDEGTTVAPIFQFLAGNAGGFALTVAVPLATLAGLWIASIIAARIAVVYQIAKFGLVGVTNTLVDLGTVNFLIYLTNIHAGGALTAFKGAGFVVANVHSFAWNKLWTFRETGNSGRMSAEYQKFFVVSVIGLLLNAAVFYGVVRQVPGGFDRDVWSNIASAVGSVVSLGWNFIGYKFFVFIKGKASVPPAAPVAPPA